MLLRTLQDVLHTVHHLLQQVWQLRTLRHYFDLLCAHCVPLPQLLLQSSECVGVVRAELPWVQICAHGPPLDVVALVLQHTRLLPALPCDVLALYPLRAAFLALLPLLLRIHHQLHLPLRLLVLQLLFQLLTHCVLAPPLDFLRFRELTQTSVCSCCCGARVSSCALVHTTYSANHTSTLAYSSASYSSTPTACRLSSYCSTLRSTTCSPPRRCFQCTHQRSSSLHDSSCLFLSVARSTYLPKLSLPVSSHCSSTPAPRSMQPRLRKYAAS
uniref:Uncharacterized protein n=1 Tax=Lygus hesperus TaxID=30085 RepID=A0A146KZY8_LYGHE